MRIGIIGTGNIGGTLARKLGAAGHEVSVANSRGVEGVRRFAAEIGAKAVDVAGAVSGADVVILAIPLPAMAELPAGLFSHLPPHATVIDTSNYYPGLRDPRIREIDSGMAESVWVSLQIGVPVIKAFNTVLAYTLAELGQPESAPARIAIAVAGDDAASKRVAMSLVEQTGFEAVDAGSLEESWRQQPSTPAYCCDYGANQMREGLAAAVRRAAEKKRDCLPEVFAKLGAAPSHADVIALCRQENSVLAEGAPGAAN